MHSISISRYMMFTRIFHRFHIIFPYIRGCPFSASIQPLLSINHCTVLAARFLVKREPPLKLPRRRKVQLLRQPLPILLCFRRLETSDCRIHVQIVPVVVAYDVASRVSGVRCRRAHPHRPT